MYRYILWKAFTSFVALFLVVSLVYVLFVAVSGNPFGEAPEPGETIEQYNQKLARYGINDPILTRFFNYIGGFFRGDFGQVFNINNENSDNIAKMFFEPLKKSMFVTVPSFLIGMVIGMVLGFIAGYKRGTVVDTSINSFVTFFIAVPTFVIASFALILAPSLGLPVTFLDTETPGVSASQSAESLILPILVLTLFSITGWVTLLRIEVSNILSSDFVLAARTRGFNEFEIFRKYVLRNSMYPYIRSLVTSFMVLLGSSLVAERFFNIPGTSLLLLRASQNGEINIIMFNMIFFSFIGIFTTMLGDVAQFSINPLIKAQFNSKPSPIQKISAHFARRRELKEVIND